MFMSMRMSKRTVMTLFAVVIVTAALLVIDRFTSAENVTPTACQGAYADERCSFLSNYGWETDPTLETSDRVVIPEVFDEVYTRYNDIQTAQGFDLTGYRGRTVTRYTLPVLNYPDCDDEVYADLLVLDGIIIGGDICTYSADGFMHGFAADGTTGLPVGQQAL